MQRDCNAKPAGVDGSPLTIVSILYMTVIVTKLCVEKQQGGLTLFCSTHSGQMVAQCTVLSDKRGMARPPGPTTCTTTD